MHVNSENERALYLSRGIAFLPNLDEGVAYQVMEDLSELALSKPEYVRMVVKSFGGYTDDGFELAGFIEHDLGVPVYADVVYSHSASTYPLLCCEKRIGRKESHFVLHHQTTAIETQYDPVRFDEMVDAWRAENHAIFARQAAFYARKLSATEDKAKEILTAGSAAVNNRIGAEAALKMGILTAIVNEDAVEPT